MQEQLEKSGLDKLLELADFLETRVAPDRFDLSRWVGEDWAGSADLSCGTTACALGWATVLWPNTFYFDTEGIPRHTVTGKIGLSAACVEFGLNQEEANFLFTSNMEVDFPFQIQGALYDNEATPKRIASLLRLFVEEKRRNPNMNLDRDKRKSLRRQALALGA